MIKNMSKEEKVSAFIILLTCLFCILAIFVCHYARISKTNETLPESNYSTSLTKG